MGSDEKSSEPIFVKGVDMESGIPVLYQESEDTSYTWSPAIYLEETKYGHLVCTLVIVDEDNKLNYTRYTKLVKRVKLPEYFMTHDFPPFYTRRRELYGSNRLLRQVLSEVYRYEHQRFSFRR